jgi:hypothetical protein
VFQGAGIHGIWRPGHANGSGDGSAFASVIGLDHATNWVQRLPAAGGGCLGGFTFRQTPPQAPRPGRDVARLYDPASGTVVRSLLARPCNVPVPGRVALADAGTTRSTPLGAAPQGVAHDQPGGQQRQGDQHEQ